MGEEQRGRCVDESCGVVGGEIEYADGGLPGE